MSPGKPGLFSMTLNRAKDLLLIQIEFGSFIKGIPPNHFI
jgi:hypothetical protein